MGARFRMDAPNPLRTSSSARRIARARSSPRQRQRQSWRSELMITHLQALVANQLVADQEAALTNLPPDFIISK
jgi:hypothetical protein